MKIRNKLITYFLIILLVPVSILSFVQLRNSQINLENQIIGRLESLADHRKALIEDFFLGSNDVLRIISGDPELKTDFSQYNRTPTKALQENIDNQLTSFISSVKEDEVKSVSLVNLSGKIIASTDGTELGVDFSDEPFFVGSKDKAGTYFIKKDGVVSIYLTAPVFVDGKTIGFVVGIADMDILGNIIKDRSGLESTGEVLLSTKDASGNPQFVFKRMFEDQAIYDNYTSIPSREALLGKEEVLNPALDYRGVSVVAATRYLKDLDAGLVVKIDRTEINSPLTNVFRTTVVVSLFGIFLTILIAWFLSKNFSDPIQELMEITKKISKDNLHVNFPEDLIKSKDEIGALSLSFKSMMKSLSGAYQDLKETGRKLNNALKYEKELISAANVMIVGLNLEGRVTVFNEAAEKISGYNKEEVIDRNWFEMVVPRFRFPEVWKAFEEFQKQGGSIIKDLQNPIITKSGEEKVIEWRNSDLFEDGKKIGTISYGIDVTERVRVEKSLHESEQKFSAAFNASPDSMIVSRFPDGKIIEVNEGFTRLFGYSREEALGKTTIELSLWVNTEEREKLIFDLQKNGHVSDFEVMLHRKDGSTFTTLNSARLFKLKEETFIISTSHDISDRKKMEDTIRRDEYELKKAQHLGRIGNWSWDIATDTITWSDEYYKLMGFDPKQPPPKYDEHLKAYTLESAARLDTAVKRNMQTGESYEIDLEVANPKSPTRWIKAISETIYDKDGKVVGLRGTAQDITERKQAEYEIAKKDRALTMLNSVNQALVHATDEKELLKEACHTMAKIGKYPMLWIGYKENNKEKSVRPVEYYGFEPGYLESLHLSWADTDVKKLPVGIAVFSGMSYLIRDIPSESQDIPWKQLALNRGCRSVAAFPLNDGKETFGAITIFATEKDAFQEDELKILEELAGDLAFGIVSLRTNTERKKLEEELLKASSDRYKALFVSSRDAIMTLEPPDWKFTSGNPSTIEMFRAKSEGDFLNHEPWAVSPDLQPDGRRSEEKAKEMIDKAMREGSNLFEWTHKRLDGEEFPAEVFLSKVEQAGHVFLHALVRDITQRKQLEEKVKEYAEERFKVIFDNSNDGLVLVDLETNKFFLANAAFCRTLGYSQDEIHNLKVSDIHPKEDLSHVLEEFNRQVRREINVAEDIRVKRKDGSIFYSDVNASPVTLNGRKYLLGAFRDITLQKKIEDELRESEERFRKVFENGQYGIILTGADSRFIKVNPAFCEITGYTEAELLTKKFSDITHPDDVERDNGSVPKLIKGEIPYYHTEKRYIKKNGESVWINLFISVIKNTDGSFRYFLGMVRDITKEKEVEKMRTDFLSLASHQLRTPLSGTKWLIETIKRGILGKLNPEQGKYMDTLYQINERMIRLVSDMLDVLMFESSDEPVKKDKVSVSEVCKELMVMMKPVSQSKKIALSNTFEKKKDIIIVTNVQSIRSIVENFLSNAINYSNPGQKVVLDVKEDSKNVIFLVKDNGIGIPKNEQKKVSERFYRASNAKKLRPDGSGLGLYTSNVLAEKIGAKISFESNENKGSIFSLSVPKQ